MNRQWCALPGPAHELGEEPTLDATNNRLLWVDVPRGEIWSRNLDGLPPGDAQLLHRIAGPISAARPHPQGIVAAFGLDVLILRPDGSRQSVARIPGDPSTWQVNGLITLPGDTVLAGLLSRDRSQVGSVVLCRDGVVTTAIANVQAANGFGVDTPRRAVWHIDTHARTLTRFAQPGINGQALDAGEIICRFDGIPGVPDGLCIDPDGDVWVAMWDGSLIVRITPTGQISEHITVPVTRPTCPLRLGNQLLTTTARSTSAHPLDGRLLRTTL